MAATRIADPAGPDSEAPALRCRGRKVCGSADGGLVAAGRPRTGVGHARGLEWLVDGCRGRHESHVPVAGHGGLDRGAVCTGNPGGRLLDRPVGSVDEWISQVRLFRGTRRTGVYPCRADCGSGPGRCRGAMESCGAAALEISAGGGGGRRLPGLARLAQSAGTGEQLCRIAAEFHPRTRSANRHRGCIEDGGVLRIRVSRSSIAGTDQRTDVLCTDGCRPPPFAVRF